jgi:hypothetical protein
MQRPLKQMLIELSKNTRLTYFADIFGHHIPDKKSNGSKNQYKQNSIMHFTFPFAQVFT